MFPGQKLPTLDTSLWVQDGVVKYEFYEKPTVWNLVLQRNTALPISSLRSTLLQETVRRLLNTDSSLDKKRKQEILSAYAQKMINSGHSEMSTRITIVQGVAKYLNKVKASLLPTDDPDYMPLFLPKEYLEEERQVSKYMSKLSWFKTKATDDEQSDISRSNRMNWRRNIPKPWCGSEISQRPTRGMKYSSLLQVHNTAGGLFIRNLL